MSAFIVVTENYYGGESMIKVFREQNQADTYAECIYLNGDRVILEVELPANVKKVFITVTEEWYGGGEKIKLFETREEAEKYGEVISNGELDTLSLELVVE